MILEELKVLEIIKDLQKLLRIQDWDITFEFMTKDKFEEEFGADNQAHNEVTRVLNACHIVINKDTTCNWYQSLMHELVHLVFDHLEMASVMVYQLTKGTIQEATDDTLTVCIERTVDRIACILCELYPLKD